MTRAACPAGALLLAVAATAAANPYPVEVESGETLTAAGDRIAYDLYVPVPGAGRPEPPWPGVVLNHGFARSRTRHAANARYLAERGIVTLVPDMVSLLGGEEAQLRNVANTAGHLDWLAARAARPGDRLEGLLEPGRLGLAGHSAGGAVSFEAAVTAGGGATPPAALLLLDAVPWPRTREIAGALPPLFAASLRAEPSLCNAVSSVVGLLADVTVPGDDALLLGTTHCDPENPGDALCALACGGSSSGGRLLYQRLLYLFFRDALEAPAVEAEPGSFRGALEELAGLGWAVRDSFGRSALARLRVDGCRATGGTVPVTGVPRVGLDLYATADAPALDWYLGLSTGGAIAWLTASGAAAEPAPLLTGAPVPLSDQTLFELPLEPGAAAGVVIALVDGAGVVTLDAIGIVRDPAP